MSQVVLVKLISIFVTAFLAGSFIPMGSEALLIYYQSQKLHWIPLLISSSLGNTLGGMSCFFLAYIGGERFIIKYLSIKKERIDKWKSKVTKGEWMALFCWLPIIGEVIAACLGLISRNWKQVFIYMLVGKAVRYSIVLGVGDILFP